MSIAASSKLHRTARSDAAENAGRAGLAARGVLYIAAAVLAFRLVLGVDSERIDKEGAIAGVAHQPLGRVLVLVLVAGFVGYAIWRFARAFSGAAEGGKERDGAGGAAKRALDVGRGLLYLAFAWTALKFVLEGRGSSSPNEQEQDWTARLLERQYGPWLVGAAGLGLIAIGVGLVVQAARTSFAKKLDLSAAPEPLRAPFTWLGVAGHVARGVIIAAVGWFIVQAAAHYDPKEAVGVDGALKRMLDQSWGRPVVLAVAVGMLAFGLFSFVEARYRKILEG
jgi:hypothetical protein